MHIASNWKDKGRAHSARSSLEKGNSQHSLVGVGMVHIVLDPPGLKGVYEGGKHEGPHNVLHKFVLAERSVPAVMSNDKELHTYRKFGGNAEHLRLQCYITKGVQQLRQAHILCTRSTKL